MFTRCPDCRTVFHITAAELRAADGTVVCGACDATFDALETLSETRPDDDAEESLPDDDRPMVAAPDEALLDDEPDGEAFLAKEAEAAERLADDEALFADEAAGSIPGDELEDDLPDPDSVFRVDDFGDELRSSSTDPFVGDDDDDDQDAGETSPVDLPVSAHGQLQDAAGGAPEKDVPPAPEEQPETEARREDSMPAFVQEQRRGSVFLKVLLPLVAIAVLAGTWAHVQRGKLLRTPAGETVLGSIASRSNSRTGQHSPNPTRTSASCCWIASGSAWARTISNRNSISRATRA
jgi:predicted Zn finger-like uncharacterized protein